MGCTSVCVKCCLNTVNTLWAIGSILMIAVAALWLGSGPSVIIYLLFAVGGVGLISSILGCCGICKEHVCMTTAYAALILVSLIMQIGGLIFSSSVEGVRKYADEDISKLWEKEIVSPGAMDIPQQTYLCCGKYSPQDYIQLGRNYPNSCYPNERVNLTRLYTTGCIEKAEHIYVELVRNLINGSWGSIAFTAILLIFSIYLIVRFRRKQGHHNY